MLSGRAHLSNFEPFTPLAPRIACRLPPTARENTTRDKHKHRDYIHLMVVNHETGNTDPIWNTPPSDAWQWQRTKSKVRVALRHTLKNTLEFVAIAMTMDDILNQERPPPNCAEYNINTDSLDSVRGLSNIWSASQLRKVTITTIQWLKVSK